MKIMAITAISCAVVLGGCSTSRAYRPGMSGTSGGALAIPESTPTLGNPAPPFRGPGNSFAPARSGPSLGLPEANRDAGSASSPSARLHAPEPRPRSGRRRSDSAAAVVSAADRPSILDEPKWSRYFRSTDRRPIESLIVGTGPERIAIISSLHGDETQSVFLLEELARTLRQHSEYLRGATVLLVKSPNPDGFVSRSPYNINGVDLNRNFPSPNWKELRNARAGARAASEAETRVIVRLLSDFHPQVLVHLKDSRQTGFINCEGNIESRGRQLAEMISAQVVQGLGEKTTGSVENYALTRQVCPSLTLVLTREASDEAAWAKNRDMLLAILKQAPSAHPGKDLSNSFDGQPDPFEEPTIHKSSMRRRKLAGEETPGNLTTSAQAGDLQPLPDFPAPVPEHGYLELPPP
jgi:protein MpaA